VVRPKGYENRPMSDSNRPEDEENDGTRSRNNLLFLLFAVVLVVAGIWLVNKLIDMRNLENCLESGRRNCAPIETPQPR
jgi:flagellar biogenesis protein FliO